MNHVVSFSGGKDSTAMLLMMLEKDMPIDEIIFCDTGKSWFTAEYIEARMLEALLCGEAKIIDWPAVP